MTCRRNKRMPSQVTRCRIYRDLSNGISFSWSELKVFFRREICISPDALSTLPWSNPHHATHTYTNTHTYPLSPYFCHYIPKSYHANGAAFRAACGGNLSFIPSPFVVNYLLFSSTSYLPFAATCFTSYSSSPTTLINFLFTLLRFNQSRTQMEPPSASHCPPKLWTRGRYEPSEFPSMVQHCCQLP
ncbi:hypothetical protein K505DRAFT_143959 [Melanomma pulvis-pyrius CBS 109.77]|uniref:Uncharacterized protein n=1 Tax=Melanomma pulvis-pyrius CBS 109.77 TaxID=1314802 RepID=A0A6A6XLZ2_9PLEO|nr:hypothetical protein K505DRAFT_143959 [Melanomma pulvis-pyrius CBS 109.77]